MPERNTVSSLRGGFLTPFLETLSTRPARPRSQRPFCSCPDPAPAQRRRDARCTRTSGRGPGPWRTRRDTAAASDGFACSSSCNSPLGFSRTGITQFAEGRLEFAEDELASRFEPAIEEYRAEQRLVSVRQRRRPFRPPCSSSPRLKIRCCPMPEVPGVLGQRAAVDEFGAGLGQRAFAEGGEFLVKLASKDKLQHGVAEEFEPLIGWTGAPCSWATEGCVSASPARPESRNI